MRFHSGNIHPPVPIACCVHLKGSHESIRTVLICIDCDVYRWKTSGDLMVLELLLVMQQCYTKYCCFLYERDSVDKKLCA